jgi:ureidoglycolate hydrolase
MNTQTSMAQSEPMSHLAGKRVSLPASWITTAAFAPYGQVIWSRPHGGTFDASDAQLELDQGIPRLYLMRLEQRGRRFVQITRHRCCTQCLGSLGGKDWLLAVAPPSATADPIANPDLSALAAFRIPGDCFIKLHRGTWHAGPYFDHEFADFYNLELSNTNLQDHDSARFESCSL